MTLSCRVGFEWDHVEMDGDRELISVTARAALFLCLAANEWKGQKVSSGCQCWTNESRRRQSPDEGSRKCKWGW